MHFEAWGLLSSLNISIFMMLFDAVLFRFIEFITAEVYYIDYYMHYVRSLDIIFLI